MYDLKIDDNNDLDITNYDLSLIEGIDQIKQKLKIRLQFFYGEWYLDTTMGIKYYENILIKNPLLNEVESILKAAILETPGVSDLTNFSLEYDGSRQININFTVNTIEGSLTLNEVIP